MQNLTLHNQEMECPKCHSTHITKNGYRQGKQNYHCQSCGRQFVEFYAYKGFSAQVKKYCLTLYVNGIGFRAIERITGVNHNTVIQLFKSIGQQLPNGSVDDFIPQIAQIDELQTFVGSKNLQ